MLHTVLFQLIFAVLAILLAVFVAILTIRYNMQHPPCRVCGGAGCWFCHYTGEAT